MSDDPDIHDLARQVAVLEERMNTKQAEYESALDRLRADMARRDLGLYGLLIALLAGVVLALLRLYVFPGTG